MISYLSTRSTDIIEWSTTLHHFRLHLNNKYANYSSELHPKKTMKRINLPLESALLQESQQNPPLRDCYWNSYRIYCTGYVCFFKLFTVVYSLDIDNSIRALHYESRIFRIILLQFALESTVIIRIRLWDYSNNEVRDTVLTFSIFSLNGPGWKSSSSKLSPTLFAQSCRVWTFSTYFSNQSTYSQNTLAKQ